MILIAGLGPGAVGHITLETWDIITTAQKVFLRTARHPCVADLKEKGVIFQSFDEYYEKFDTFEEVYSAISEYVVKEAQKASDSEKIVFAVPGSPFVAEKTVELIIEAAASKKVPVRILPAMSFLDALYVRLKVNPSNGLTVVDCADITALPRNINTALVVTQVFDKKSASDAKIALMDYYRDDHQVTVVTDLGLNSETLKTIPLYELDRLTQINHLTSVYVPPKLSCNPARSFERLLNIMAKLRSPQGCAWDLEQTPESIRAYLIEEVYEVIEAIDLGDNDLLLEELGDLLLHIVFHAQMAEESNLFSMQDIIDGIIDKMIRRHPHVFGNATVKDSAEVIVNWDKIKKQEKKADRLSALDGIPKGLPGLLRAFKLQDKAAKVGFDFASQNPVWDKIYEELVELKEASEPNSGRIIRGIQDKTKYMLSGEKEIQDELGDVLFSIVNLARFLKTDPETALNHANNKFERRFKYIETQAQKQGLNFAELSLKEMDKLWEKAKKEEFELFEKISAEN